MKRRTLLSGAAALAAAPLARPHAQKPVTVRWWYHFDNAQASPAALVSAFEKANPDIRIQAESIPWGGGADYDNRLYASLIAGNAPDTAMVKFQNLARLMEMEALRPLDAWLDAWPGRADISDDLWKLHRAPDGKRYYLPVQYVVLYLYVRQDWFAQKNLKLPATFASSSPPPRRSPAATAGASACAAARAGTISGAPSCSAAGRGWRRAASSRRPRSPPTAGSSACTPNIMSARPRRRMTGSSRSSPT